MAQKLEAKGGKKGGVWDDGVHDGIRKIYVGQGQDCIAFVKFEYADGSEVVVGDEHGKKTLLGTEEVIIIYTIIYFVENVNFVQYWFRLESYFCFFSRCSLRLMQMTTSYTWKHSVIKQPKKPSWILSSRLIKAKLISTSRQVQGLSLFSMVAKSLGFTGVRAMFYTPLEPMLLSHPLLNCKGSGLR